MTLIERRKRREELYMQLRNRLAANSGNDESALRAKVAGKYVPLHPDLYQLQPV
jgi:hypothetical protein